MEIYLLRHAAAEDGPPGMKDSDRALTPEGREKLKRVLKRARNADVKPDVILSSPYRRALETAEMAAEALGYRRKIVQTETLVPNASPYDVWQEVRSRRDEGAILLASHEPLMSATVALFLANPGMLVDMKKSALVRVDVERFGPEPHGILKWMLTPALAGE
ncbi:MAG TPA: histidine phosphatase family protein [Bryobacteraceae bacterium]|nr:histidine phosphatase family protein [Bryobacteraceae bacterium]